MSCDGYRLDNGDNIDSESVNEAIAYIEGDMRWNKACGRVADQTGWTVDEDALSVRVDGYQLGVSTSLGLEVFADIDDPQYDALDQIGSLLIQVGRELKREVGSTSQSVDAVAIKKIDDQYRKSMTRVRALAAFLVVAISWLCWRVW